MDRCCTLCDALCEPGEMLCAACLSDPDQREAYQALVLLSRRRHALVAYYTTARRAIRLARVYRAEGDGDSRRVRACLAEVRRCRDAIRAVHRGRAPGLTKTRPTPAEIASRRVS